jgi:hypothetical protein
MMATTGNPRGLGTVLGAGRLMLQPHLGQGVLPLGPAFVDTDK